MEMSFFSACPKNDMVVGPDLRGTPGSSVMGHDEKKDISILFLNFTGDKYLYYDTGDVDPEK
jgi:hypothetical protein